MTAIMVAKTTVDRRVESRRAAPASTAIAPSASGQTTTNPDASVIHGSSLPFAPSDVKSAKAARHTAIAKMPTQGP
ncbi:MAG: hypothetical protein U1D55_13690 [Phycisphaerae bacterium]